MVTKEFIKEHKRFLVGVYKSKDRKLTREDLQDLVQDTFEKVTLYQDYFDETKGTLRNWLQMLCVHVWDRHKRGMLVIDEIQKDYTSDDLIEPTNDYFYSANKEEVDSLIDMLPKTQRLAVYYKLILGFTHEEVAGKLRCTTTASQTTYTRGLANLKKLIASDNPEKEVLHETKILKPYGDKPFDGDWAWQYGRSADHRNSKCHEYTQDEIKEYCDSRQLNYKLKG